MRGMQAVIGVAASLVPLTALAGGPGSVRPVTSRETRQAVTELAGMLRASYAMAETAEAAVSRRTAAAKC